MVGAIRVYPRVCGGTSCRRCAGSSPIGLSPRVRGNQLPLPHQPLHLRSIPACAGEPTAPAAPAAPSPVYPRVCGGTVIEPSGLSTEPGLSPRVRGNRYGRRNGERDRGSIPACAGEPRSACSCCTAPSVYPRVCGGTHRTKSEQNITEGLSPRVRGNHRPNGGPKQRTRSIPACAGEPLPAWHPKRKPPVYPRVCGGTMLARLRLSIVSGLSPRVRGNLLVGLIRPVGKRSIPACAGEPATERP